MFISLTRGSYRHSEPVGAGTPLIVRLTDVERIEEIPHQHWVGEPDDVFHAVGSNVYLRSFFGPDGRSKYTGDGYGYVTVREPVAEIMSKIKSALPPKNRRSIVEHVLSGVATLRQLVQHNHRHEPVIVEFPQLQAE